MSPSHHKFENQIRKTLHSLGDLPIPTAQNISQSGHLAEQIQQVILENGGAIGFDQFIEMALYHPVLGYYSSTLEKFGPSGDFITAPELTPLFGFCLAKQCRQVLQQIEGGNILEVGAGSGRLAITVMSECERLNCIPEKYFILEISSHLKQQQYNNIEKAIPQHLNRFCWLDQLPSDGFRGVVIANELVDAIPFEIFNITNQGIQQRLVAFDGQQFVWRDQKAGDEISRRVNLLALNPPYQSEIHLQAESWLRSIADTLVQGVVIILDYGFSQSEYYHPQRNEGTLMCHYRHRAHPDPLVLVGLQDITTHINFSAMANTAIDAGLSVLGYDNQANFLLGLGIEKCLMATAPVSSREYIEAAQAVKKLIMPSEMGELFKVLALGKNFNEPLIAFELSDRRHSL